MSPNGRLFSWILVDDFLVGLFLRRPRFCGIEILIENIVFEGYITKTAQVRFMEKAKQHSKFCGILFVFSLSYTRLGLFA